MGSVLEYYVCRSKELEQAVKWLKAWELSLNNKSTSRKYNKCIKKIKAAKYRLYELVN